MRKRAGPPSRGAACRCKGCPGWKVFCRVASTTGSGVELVVVGCGAVWLWGALIVSAVLGRDLVCEFQPAGAAGGCRWRVILGQLWRRR